MSPRRRSSKPVRLAGRWLLAGCLAVQAAGCAVLVSKDEYRAYRAVRLAPDQRARLVRMRAYLDAHPRGAWATDFQSEREALEAAVFEASRDDRAGLSLYLRAYPDGAFAEQARSRLQALSALEAREQDRAAQAKARAAAEEARAAELRRTWVARFADYWLEVFFGLVGWGSPIDKLAAANPEFSAAFGRPPRPRCTQAECLKYYTATYSIPVPGSTRLERTAQLLLRLRVRRGRVVGAELLFPGWGFSRWSELERGTVVMDADPAERSAAVAWALERLRGLLREAGELRPLAGQTPLAFQVPEVGPSGELIDPTAADPGVVTTLPGTGGLPAVGATVPPPERAAVQAEDLGEPDLVLDVVVVPAADPSAPSASGSEGSAAGVITVLPQASSSTPIEPVVETYRVGDYRVVLFAAGGNDSGAYDGLRIEPVL